MKHSFDINNNISAEDSHQLGSIEYAADHLGGKLIVVLGHDHCGAVEAAIHHDPDGHVDFF